jgi:hypothetical protein
MHIPTSERAFLMPSVAPLDFTDLLTRGKAVHIGYPHPYFGGKFLIFL